MVAVGMGQIVKFKVFGHMLSTHNMVNFLIMQYFYCSLANLLVCKILHFVCNYMCYPDLSILCALGLRGNREELLLGSTFIK